MVTDPCHRQIGHMNFALLEIAGGGGIAHGTGTATKYSLCVNGKEVRRLTVTQEGKFLSKKSFPTAQLYPWPGP